MIINIVKRLIGQFNSPALFVGLSLLSSQLVIDRFLVCLTLRDHLFIYKDFKDNSLKERSPYDTY